MKVNQTQLENLLELAATDLLILRSKNAIEELKRNPEHSEISQRLRASSASFLEANNKVETLQLELRRLETDVDLVEKRIAKDNASLRETSVVKNAQGIQHELKTLAKRKAELEDQELAIMEALGEAENEVAAASADRKLIEDELAAKTAELEAEFRKIASGLELTNSDRKQLADRIPAELLDVYVAKSKRGVPIGRLSHRECGACRISIGATALAEIMAKPADEIVTCPDCGAILVRV